MLARNERSLGGFGPPSTAFQGNPNVTITAISTAGGIVKSRSSGQLPAFVQVSASAITATGTSVPYRDLEYQWDFGDPGGTEVFTDPYTGLSVNMNSAQYGPGAAYCYRSAGTKTITLTARGKNGSGFTTASVTTSFSASAFSASGGDFFIDFAAGGGGSGTIGSPFNSIAQVNAALANNTRFNFKLGSSVTGSAGIDMTNAAFSGVRFTSYGSGALPVITVNGANNGFAIANGGSSTAHNQSDIVVSNINFQSATGWSSGGLVGASVGGNATGTINDLYFDGVQAINNIDPTATNSDCFDISDDKVLMTNGGIWNCTGTSPLGVSSNHNRQIYHGGASNWNFITGFSCSGAGTDAVFDHHIYPHGQTQILFSYINFGSGPNKNYCLNLDWDSVSGNLEFAEFILITNCNMTGVLRGHDAADINNDPTKVQFRNFVVQKSLVHDLGGNGVFSYAGGLGITYRDLNIWGCNGGDVFSPDGPTTAVFHIYRINGYVSSGSGEFIKLSNETWSNKHTLTDIKIQDDRVSADIVGMVFSNQSGATIDRNVWYAPNDGDAKFLFDSGHVAKAFGPAGTAGTWQNAGFDANGNTSNPGFPSPSTGNFG